MNQTQRIADSYRAATIKGAWYGPSLAELLKEISLDLAAAPPLRGHIPFRLCFSICSFGMKEFETLRRATQCRLGNLKRNGPNSRFPWNELVTHWNQSRDLLDLPFRADRDALEHAPQAISLVPRSPRVSATSSQATEPNWQPFACPEDQRAGLR